MGPMPPRLWLTLSDHLFAGRVARMFHVEHLTSGLPGRSLVLAKVTSPVGVTLARSLRSRLARLFHVEHWTTTPARTKCGWSRWRPHWEWTILPPSSVPTELARMFHVEHLTCLRNLVVANPTSAFVAAPCPPYSAGASPDCSSGAHLAKSRARTKSRWLACRPSEPTLTAVIYSHGSPARMFHVKHVTPGRAGQNAAHAKAAHTRT